LVANEEWLDPLWAELAWRAEQHRKAEEERKQQASKKKGVR
jgi:hypothetical protein